MDCDRYERVLMDLLYGELDELTRASANRHADQCSRCRQLLARLKATREIGVLPLEEPPESFEARILAAERRVHEGLPLRVRLGRSLTIIGGYAMRPQLAMAALALLMIGSSLAFLRPRPGAHTGTVQISQRGIPTPEPDAVMVPIAEPPPPAEPEPSAEPELHAAEQTPSAPSADAPARPAPEPSASLAIAAASASAPSTEDELDLARQRAEDRDYTAAMAAFRHADYLSAQQQFDAIVAAGGRNAAAAELYASLAAEESTGCSAALPRFDSVAAKYPETHLAHTATWHSATCRAKLGLNRRAALDFERLLRVPAYADRARAVLNQPGLGAAAAADQSVLSPAGEGEEQAPVSKAMVPKKPSAAVAASAAPTATAPPRPSPPQAAPPPKAPAKGSKLNRAKSKSTTQPATPTKPAPERR